MSKGLKCASRVGVSFLYFYLHHEKNMPSQSPLVQGGTDTYRTDLVAFCSLEPILAKGSQPTDMFVIINKPLSYSITVAIVN